jgi:hypothetical protein
MGRKGINTHELANHHFGRRLLLVHHRNTVKKLQLNQQVRVLPKILCQISAKFA